MKFPIYDAKSKVTVAPTFIFHTAVTTIEINYILQKVHIKDIRLLQKYSYCLFHLLDDKWWLRSKI